MTTDFGPKASSNGVAVPPFVPHPLLRNGHLQTIVGRYLAGRRVALPSVYHEVPTGDGDRLAVLDSSPPGWDRGDPVALLIHGLSGCARAPYVVRLGVRLWRKGVRAVRVNLRGAGLGFGLARGVYHAGRSEDLRLVVEWVGRRAPGSPIALIGFSLGANLALKLAAEAGQDPVDGLDCVLAANPPIDLAACARAIQRPENRLYDRNFVRQLHKDVAKLHAAFPELGPVTPPRVSTVFDFDDWYTAPRNGFLGADDYYQRSSAALLIPKIGHPGLVVHAEDDPFIPTEPFRSVEFPPQLALELIPNGGHLGYVSDARWGGDRRWLDARLTDWLATRWSLHGEAVRDCGSNKIRPND
jgi:predicted alpha/beta-fold hydrolase